MSWTTRVRLYSLTASCCLACNAAGAATEFTYHKFVLKKIFDDNALKKLALIYALVVALMSYLLHVVESVNITCVWEVGAVSAVDGTRGAESLVCSRFGWDDALWVIATTCLSTGYVQR